MCSHSCTHRCTLALVGRTLLHTSGLLQCLAPRLSEPRALRRHPVSEGDSPGVRSPWDLFEPQVQGVVTTAGASPGVYEKDNLFSVPSFHCHAQEGLQSHISWALLALQSLLPGVTLSQEAGPGEVSSVFTVSQSRTQSMTGTGPYAPSLTTELSTQDGSLEFQQGRRQRLSPMSQKKDAWSS